ncbi:MAG: sigma E protease regulator RseP [Gammaproteobacteria bacterium]|nr:sigma E protease regulator RseP [Gammaproteobacteria bacterium]
MSSFIISVLALVVTLGLLIAFHEFGHFWTARKLGVKVLRYSVGFGKPLLMRRSGPDQTEYVLAMIPLGGYVKMLDEREGEVAPEEQHRAFNRQTVWRRFAIVAAGPMFNFIFAILAFWLMYVIGVPGMKPIIGEVLPESPAAVAGFQTGDQITSINGHLTPTWSTARITLLDETLDADSVSVVVRGKDGQAQTLTLSVADIPAEKKQKNLFSHLGLAPARPLLPAVLGELKAGGAAEQAGLRSGDQVLSANGEPLADWMALVDVVRKNPGNSLQLEVERDGAVLNIGVTPAVTEQDGKSVGLIGAGVKPAGPPPPELAAEVQYPVFEAMGVATAKTWQLSVLTLRMIGKMFTGEVALKNLSGPITIATYAGYTASIGIGAFLYFLAVVSISLGVLNLLPVPLLDGGHLMYYLIEMIKGKPLSDAVQARMQHVGVAFLVLLMTLALYNDVARLVSGQ